MPTSHTISINIPDELYEQLQEIADQSQNSVEATILGTLKLLFRPSSDLKARLAFMESLSNEHLWEIAHQNLSDEETKRLHELIALGKQIPLSDEQTRELNQLVDREDYQILLRSKALLILKERGQNIDRFLKRGA